MSANDENDVFQSPVHRVVCESVYAVLGDDASIAETDQIADRIIAALKLDMDAAVPNGS